MFGNEKNKEYIKCANQKKKDSHKYKHKYFEYKKFWIKIFIDTIKDILCRQSRFWIDYAECKI